MLTNFLKDKLHITTRKPPTGKITYISVKPKIIARLANTLTLHSQAHNGSIHHDIDQPNTDHERLELQTESTTPCQCQTTIDQAAQLDSNSGAPTYCQKCNRAITIKNNANNNAPSCITCKTVPTTSTLLETEVCRSCQIKWLLKFNSTATRHQTLIKKLKEQTETPTIAAAKASYQVKRRITDPI